MKEVVTINCRNVDKAAWSKVRRLAVEKGITTAQALARIVRSYPKHKRG